jgi:3-oxoadipate enol-lactonase
VSDTARVLAVDLPGFGKSPLPPPQPLLDDYVAALREWAEALGLKRFVLVGHSMGGYVALNFAQHYMGRLLGLGLVCTRAGADTEQARQNRLKQIDTVWDQGTAPVVDAMLPNLLSPATKEKHPEVVAQLREIMMRASAGGIVSALWAMARRPDVTAVLPTIAVPTVVVSGADDAIIPAPEADLLAASIVGAVQERIPGAGHMPMLEQPDRLSAVLRDLARGARTSEDIPAPPPAQDIAGVRTHRHK